MNEDRLIRIEGKLDGLVTDVAVLKTDVAVLKTDVAVLKTDVERLGVAVGDLQVSASEVRAGMDVMSLDIHRLHILQEAARADAKVPFESDAGLREHMDRQFEATRREFREALAPVELALRSHTAQLNAGHGT